MDKNFIKDNKLDEAVERFRQISEYKSPKQSLKKLYEYTFITAPQVNEDGDEDLQQPNDSSQNGGEIDNDNNQNMQNSSPEPQNQGDDMNGQMGGEMQSDASQMPQNDMQQPTMNNTTPENDDMGDLSEPEVDGEEVETQEMESDDEVIDVDELTQSQEATEYKIDGVDDRLAKIYAVVQKFSDQLDKNEQSIMALKDEFEKRNPTEEEKLNIRSQSSYPYSETPKDYWDNKVKENPNYNVMYDNEVSPSEEQKKFEIKRSDISGLNMKNISDTLDINQKLSDYINF